MGIRASDYRRAGRYAAQDKANRQRRQAIDAAEVAYLEARQAYEAELRRDEDGPQPAWEAFKVARGALEALDPDSSFFA